MRYSSCAHTRFYRRFHVVWVTKHRYKVLQGPARGDRPVKALWRRYGHRDYAAVAA